jgi:hypothetical protein
MSWLHSCYPPGITGWHPTALDMDYVFSWHLHYQYWYGTIVAKLTHLARIELPRARGW